MTSANPRPNPSPRHITGLRSIQLFYNINHIQQKKPPKISPSLYNWRSFLCNVSSSKTECNRHKKININSQLQGSLIWQYIKHPLIQIKISALYGTTCKEFPIKTQNNNKICIQNLHPHIFNLPTVRFEDLTTIITTKITII